MATKAQKTSNGNGKFFLGAILGAAAGVAGHMFLKKKSAEKEKECDGKDCKCDKKPAAKKTTKKSSK